MRTHKQVLDVDYKIREMVMTHCPGHGSISTPADIDKSLFLSFIIEFCVLILIAFISAFYYLSSNAWPTVEYSPLIVLIKSLSMSLKTIDDRLGSKQIDACAGGYRHILFESIYVCVCGHREQKSLEAHDKWTCAKVFVTATFDWNSLCGCQMECQIVGREKWNRKK